MRFRFNPTLISALIYRFVSCKHIKPEKNFLTHEFPNQKINKAHKLNWNNCAPPFHCRCFSYCWQARASFSFLPFFPSPNALSTPPRFREKLYDCRCFPLLHTRHELMPFFSVPSLFNRSLHFTSIRLAVLASAAGNETKEHQGTRRKRRRGSSCRSTGDCGAVPLLQLSSTYRVERNRYIFHGFLGARALAGN